jgi:glycogen operon protein
MLLHGDEFGRTQDGNNNTYAQDSELSWLHWDDIDRPLLDFTAAVVKLRQDHPTFRRKRFFTGNTVRTGPTGQERLNDIVWLHPDGHPMEDDSWAGDDQVIGMYLNGDGIAGKGARGEPIHDDHFLIYFNADGPVDLTLPQEEYADAWDVVINTGGTADASATCMAGGTFHMEHRSVLVLQQHSEPEVQPDLSVAASVAAHSTVGSRTT